VKVTSENYEELKRTVLWLFQQLISDRMPSLDPASHPRVTIECLERQSMAAARKGVGLAIGDLIELSEGAPADVVGEWDRALQAQDLPTLSSIRAQFGHRTRSIMKRGRIRNENEYFALRNIADSLPGAEREAAWSMLDAFMMSGSGQ
jgi:hypothetical protein